MRILFREVDEIMSSITLKVKMSTFLPLCWQQMYSPQARAIERAGIDWRSVSLYSNQLNVFPTIHSMQAPLPSTEYVPPWRREWKDIQPTLLKMRRSMAALKSSPLRVMRVSQLDSDLLDVELFGMLKEQLWSAFSLFNVSIRYIKFI